MARNWFSENTKMQRQLDRHERQIRDLQEVTSDDRATLKLQEEGLTLLRKLGENHEKRIAKSEQFARWARRKIRERGR